MDDTKFNKKDKIQYIRKRPHLTGMAIVLLIGIITVSIQYSKFVDKTVYQESVSHLTEMLHQSDTALNELVNKNITYLHMWSDYLQNISNERNIRDYIEKVQKETGFSNFYFL